MEAVLAAEAAGEDVTQLRRYRLQPSVVPQTNSKL